MPRKRIEITDEMLASIENAASRGLSEQQIASTLGISMSTITRRKRDTEHFDHAIKKGRDKGIAAVTNALFKKATTGDNVAMIFFLKNRDPDNWRDRVENVVTANHTVNKIEIEVIGGDADLTD
jgi:transcriptional regulator with XRE-family HTH domain